MKRNGYCYLIRLSYLGFRYSGWQKQPGQKTIESMLSKTFAFLYPNLEYKLLGASRTDAKVSALNAAFELFLPNPLDDLERFTSDFNTNLPPDIRLESIEAIGADFNIIKDSTLKEYVYLFSFGTKAHPYCAPFLTNYPYALELSTMKKAASLFEGQHDFSVYTAELKEHTKRIRIIKTCVIEENTLLTANFFPDLSYILRVSGEGFMRYQIRMIMGALVQVGKSELTLAQIAESLEPNSKMELKTIAPGSGLHLNQLNF
ncbi:MAG: tRNA pseudouridine(38-40) synthase TruA [Maribacter sp.]